MARSRVEYFEEEVKFSGYNCILIETRTAKAYLKKKTESNRTKRVIYRLLHCMHISPVVTKFELQQLISISSIHVEIQKLDRVIMYLQVLQITLPWIQAIIFLMFHERSKIRDVAY